MAWVPHRGSDIEEVAEDRERRLEALLRTGWWALGDSNTGPIDYESTALTN